MTPEIPVHIDKIEVLKRLGYMPKTSRMTGPIEELIDREIIYGRSLIKPVFLYENFNSISICSPEIKINDKISFISNSLAKHLQGSEKMSLLACTIGTAIEGEVKNIFNQKEYTRATVLDAIGSIAIEDLAEGINRRIIQEADTQGYETTRRFSVGYGDWKLTDQEKLFYLLTPEKIGLTLTESFIMLPEKSITAVIGWKRKKLNRE